MRLRMVILCLAGLALAAVLLDRRPCAAAVPASKPASNPTSRPSTSPTSTSKPASNPASAPVENANWKVLKTDDYVIAVPRDWPQQAGVSIPFFVGNGKVAPDKDDMGDAIQVGIKVERYDVTKDSPAVTAQKDQKKTAKELQSGPGGRKDMIRPRLIKSDQAQTLKLSDGTEAAFTRTKMLKRGPRLSLELKLFAKDKIPVIKDKVPTTKDKGPTTKDNGSTTKSTGPTTKSTGPTTKSTGPTTRSTGPATKPVIVKPKDLRGVTVTAWITTGNRTQFIEKSKDLERLLKAHMTTLCFNPEKFDTTALDKAYESKPTTQPTSAAAIKPKNP